MTPEAAQPAPVLPVRSDALDRFGERLADRINPIVVKEVRQGLRTRVFWVFFVLMLVGCLVISLVAWATTTDSYSEKGGQVAFLFYFGTLGLVQFFVIPYSAYRSMAREREEETWVLLTLTGLGPRRILAGKLGSFLLQGLLYASAAAPFLLFSYYLNGIDLPTIVVAVLLGAAYQVFLTSIAVSTATLAESRLVRGLLHFVLLGLLLQALAMGITSVVAVAEGARGWSGNEEFWVAAGAALFGMITTGVLLFESAASRLALPTEQYAKGPRLAFLAQALGMAAFFILGWVVSGEAEVVPIGMVCCSAYICMVGLFVASDRDGMARNHWAAASRRSLLRPGAARGFIFVVLTLVAVTGALVISAVLEPSTKGEAFAVMLAAPGYALIYLSVPQIVARWVPHPPYQTPAMVRLVFLGLLIIGSGLPPLIGEIASEADDKLLNALNPIVGLINIGKLGMDAMPLIVLVWGVAIGTFAWAGYSLRRRDVEPTA